MGRRILAVIVAMVAAMGVIMIGEMLTASIAPHPSAADMNDLASMRTFYASLPTEVYVMTLFTHILAAFAGGFIVTKMSRQVGGSQMLAIIIGGVLTLAGLVNFFVVLPNQPVWFVIASLLCYIPLALLGHRMAR